MALREVGVESVYTDCVVAPCLTTKITTEMHSRSRLPCGPKTFKVCAQSKMQFGLPLSLKRPEWLGMTMT